MKRRLESRGRGGKGTGRSRAGAKSAARIFSSTINKGAKNLDGGPTNLTLNASSGNKMPGNTLAGAVSVNNKQSAELGKENLIQGGATVDETAPDGKLIEEGGLRGSKFDPSKFISEDFL